jgi:methyl coenzyme M reductase subunit C-like uncharacterized protein (methanogenesis marker protein 7)
VKLPYDTFAKGIRELEIEDGITVNEVTRVVPSRMRDYTLIRIKPFSETNVVV